ncbi:RteC domain-containing protein [Gillisia sp. Hel_I_86]|uniref:RteC domain-containing protein n=1 Tax=Gillisia sp. Hel_I_86 TaxID=1249981 RepID=UPI003965623C
MFNIEGKRPRRSSKSQIKYLKNHIYKLRTYLNDDLNFYHYNRRGTNTFDEHYFLRGKTDLRLYPDTFLVLELNKILIKGCIYLIYNNRNRSLK